MPIEIVVRKVLEPEFWVSDEDAAEISDEDIVDMVMDDLGEFVDGAEWVVRRS